MAEHAAAHRPYDPLWNHGAPKAKRKGSKLAIGLSIAAHAALAWGVYESKFVMRNIDYGDDVIVDLQTVRLPKPPPPPPEAKPDLPKPPPPPVHQPLNIRETILPPDLSGIPAPITLPPPVTPKPAVIEATPPAPPAPVITNPDWSSKPSGDDMARYYPERAQRLGIEGRAVIQCQVTAKGAVAGCSVLSETPEAYAFGEAAVKLSRMFKMKPRLRDGQAVEGATVKIPIVFTLG